MAAASARTTGLAVEKTPPDAMGFKRGNEIHAQPNSTSAAKLQLNFFEVKMWFVTNRFSLIASQSPRPT
jgi:hypothetical protein